MRQMLILARNGVPWDEVARMTPTRRLAAVVALREMDGEEFDWTAMRWREPER
jgi:hypothetical protein